MQTEPGAADRRSASGPNLARMCWRMRRYPPPAKMCATHRISRTTAERQGQGYRGVRALYTYALRARTDTCSGLARGGREKGYLLLPLDPPFELDMDVVAPDAGLERDVESSDAGFFLVVCFVLAVCAEGALL